MDAHDTLHTQAHTQPDEQPDEQPGVRVGELNWLLEDFLKRVPGTLAALLAARDGLRLAWHGFEVVHADHLSATLSGLHSLARSLILPSQADRLTHPEQPAVRRNADHVRQIVIECGDLVLFVMGGGDGSLLGVMTGPDADAGIVGNEMAQLVKKVKSHLTTPGRHDDRLVSDAGA